MAHWDILSEWWLPWLSLVFGEHLVVSISGLAWDVQSSEQLILGFLFCPDFNNGKVFFCIGSYCVFDVFQTVILRWILGIVWFQVLRYFGQCPPLPSCPRSPILSGIPKMSFQSPQLLHQHSLCSMQTVSSYEESVDGRRLYVWLCALINTLQEVGLSQDLLPYNADVQLHFR